MMGTPAKSIRLRHRVSKDIRTWKCRCTQSVACGTQLPVGPDTDFDSQLPVGPDTDFDNEVEDADVDTVFTIRTISHHLNPTDQGVLAKESSKDPAIVNVIWYTREGWRPKAGSMEIQRDFH